MTNYYHEVEAIPAHQVPVGSLRLLSGQQGSIFWVAAAAGTETPEHSHPMEQMSWLVSGSMDVQIGDDERRRIDAGVVVLIPGGIRHKFWYVSECTIVEFAAPPRFDWFPDAATNPYGLAPGQDAKDLRAIASFPSESTE